MNKKILPWLVVTFLAIPSAFAFFLDNVFAGLGLVDLPQFYLRFAHFIDTILFMIFFGSIALKILKKRLGVKAATVIGIILGLSLELFFYNQGITLAAFGPIAATIFMIAFGVMMYFLFKGLFEHSGSAFGAWLAYVVMLPLLMAVAPSIIDWLESANTYTKALWGIALAMWVVGLIYIIVKLFGFMKWGRGGSDGNNNGGNGGGNDGNGGNGGTEPPPGTGEPPGEPPGPDQSLLDDIDEFVQLVNNYGNQYMQQLASFCQNNRANTIQERSTLLNQHLTQANFHDTEQAIDRIAARIAGHDFSRLDQNRRDAFQGRLHDYAQYRHQKQQIINGYIGTQ